MCFYSCVQIPPPCIIPGYEEGGEVPYVIVADAAFPLRPDLLRPYPGARTTILEPKQRIFNYRLSRARNTVECAFGILSQR
mgnify:CR=1 FL=1